MTFEWVPDDSYSLDRADPTAVARIVILRTLRAPDLRGPLQAPVEFDRLRVEAQALFVYLVAHLLPLVRHVPGDDLARVALDLLRSLSGDGTRPRFDDLRRGTRRDLVDALDDVRARLLREGVV